MDPDQGGPKTCESGRSGTLVFFQCVGLGFNGDRGTKKWSPRTGQMIKYFSCFEELDDFFEGL
jgi:hypothetical protein